MVYPYAWKPYCERSQFITAFKTPSTCEEAKDPTPREDTDAAVLFAEGAVKIFDLVYPQELHELMDVFMSYDEPLQPIPVGASVFYFIMIAWITTFYFTYLGRKMLSGVKEKLDLHPEANRFPNLQLYWLQQSRREAELRREVRNTWAWLARRYLLSPNDPLLANVDQVLGLVNWHDFEVTRNQWSLVKCVLRQNGLFIKVRRFKKNKRKRLFEIMKETELKKVPMKGDKVVRVFEEWETGSSDEDEEAVASEMEPEVTVVKKPETEPGTTVGTKPESTKTEPETSDAFDITDEDVEPTKATSSVDDPLHKTKIGFKPQVQVASIPSVAPNKKSESKKKKVPEMIDEGSKKTEKKEGNVKPSSKPVEPKAIDDQNEEKKPKGKKKKSHHRESIVVVPEVNILAKFLSSTTSQQTAMDEGATKPMKEGAAQKPFSKPVESKPVDDKTETKKSKNKEKKSHHYESSDVEPEVKKVTSSTTSPQKFIDEKATKPANEAAPLKPLTKPVESKTTDDRTEGKNKKRKSNSDTSKVVTSSPVAEVTKLEKIPSTTTQQKIIDDKATKTAKEGGTMKQSVEPKAVDDLTDGKNKKIKSHHESSKVASSSPGPEVTMKKTEKVPPTPSQQKLIDEGATKTGKEGVTPKPLSQPVESKEAEDKTDGKILKNKNRKSHHESSKVVSSSPGQEVIMKKPEKVPSTTSQQKLIDEGAANTAKEEVVLKPLSKTVESKTTTYQTDGKGSKSKKKKSHPSMVPDTSGPAPKAAEEDDETVPETSLAETETEAETATETEAETSDEFETMDEGPTTDATLTEATSLQSLHDDTKSGLKTQVGSTTSLSSKKKSEGKRRFSYLRKSFSTEPDKPKRRKYEPVFRGSRNSKVLDLEHYLNLKKSPSRLNES